MDLDGAVVNHFGLLDASLNALTSAIAFIFNSLAFFLLIRINIEAPSLTGDELAAVIVPFISNTGFNSLILSALYLLKFSSFSN